jgi:hypothetical protein
MKTIRVRCPEGKLEEVMDKIDAVLSGTGARWSLVTAQEYSQEACLKAYQDAKVRGAPSDFGLFTIGFHAGVKRFTEGEL